VKKGERGRRGNEDREKTWNALSVNFDVTGLGVVGYSGGRAIVALSHIGWFHG
jgi:hypothetical protein